MKSIILVAFIFIGFQSFSMTEINSVSTKIEGSEMVKMDRKKRINKKRKRKCKKWGKRSFAG